MKDRVKAPQRPLCYFGYELAEIPEEMKASVQKWHEMMVEAAAESSEELMEKYLENGELSEDEICQGLRKATKRIIAQRVINPH